MEDGAGGTAALLSRMEPAAREAALPHGDPPRYTLFLSATDGRRRATTVNAQAATFEAAWAECSRLLLEQCPRALWLRLDWVTQVAQLTISQLRDELARTKRNYFRQGIALDDGFRHAFLEAELNANAMLYGGNQLDHSVLNDRNFAARFRTKYSSPFPDLTPYTPVCIFDASGLFLSCDAVAPVLLHDCGRDAGRRQIGVLTVEQLDSLIAAGSAYLARQVGPDGKFA